MKKIGLLTIFLVYSIDAKVLIWDFGGIVFNPDKFGVARAIGIKHFVSYMLLDMKNPNIQKLLFDFLDLIMPKEHDKQYVPAKSAENMQLPLIMCHWQAGTIKGPEIINIVKKKIKEFEKIGFFSSEREKTLLKKTISAIFNPEILAKNVYPLNAGVELLKDCAEARNYDGTRKNINIGFSNWDPLSFDIFYKKYKNVFRHFDNVLVSGHIKLIKPDKRAYQYLLESLKLNPKDCILIDDQKINAAGAKQCNIKSILLKNWDYQKLRNELRKAGAL